MPIRDPFAVEPSGIKDPFAAAQEPAVSAIAKKPNSGLIRRLAGDTGVSIAKGIVSTGEAAVGLLDLPTGGAVGNALQNSLGYDPKATHATLESLYSPEQQEANRKVQEAEGFTGTLKAYAENPSTIPHGVISTLGVTGLGGAIGQGAIKLAPKLAPVVAAGIGEGAVGAGSAAEQLRQGDGNLSLKDTVAAVGQGGITGLIGVKGGQIAQKLGIVDPDVLLAGGVRNVTNKNVIRRIAEGAVTEGAFEELPQSVQEQMWQNFATGQPLLDNTGKAGAQGLALGAAMGGAFNVLPQPTGPISKAVESGIQSGAVPVAPVAPEAGPLESAVDRQAFIDRQFGITPEQKNDAEIKRQMQMPLTEAGATRRAEEMTAATGQPHAAIPHPTVAGRFAVVNQSGFTPEEVAAFQQEQSARQQAMKRDLEIQRTMAAHEGEAQPNVPQPEQMAAQESQKTGQESQALDQAPVQVAPEFVKTKTLYGDTVNVRKADLEGERARLPIYTAAGERKGGVVHRENLDLTGEKQKALNAENANNPFFDVVSAKDGKPFASIPAANREMNRSGLRDSHEVVKADTVQAGLNGFVIKRKAVQSEAGLQAVAKTATPVAKPETVKSAISTVTGGDNVKTAATQNQSITQKPNGDIHVLGYPTEVLQAARKTLGANAVIDAKGQAIFRSGTDLTALRETLNPGAAYIPDAKSLRKEDFPGQVKDGKFSQARAHTFATKYGVKSFDSKDEAQAYAEALQKGEGGNWQAKKFMGKWRAVRNKQSEVGLTGTQQAQSSELTSTTAPEAAPVQESATFTKPEQAQEVNTPEPADMVAPATQPQNVSQKAEGGDTNPDVSPDTKPAPQQAKGKDRVAAAQVDNKPAEVDKASSPQPKKANPESAKAGEGKPAEADKAPWQMTQTEYLAHRADTDSSGRYEWARNDSALRRNRIASHEMYVEDAIADGRDVPAEVLADYPSLADKAPEGKIEDFGEKIGGARKDVWTSYKDKLDDAKEVDIKAEPLSKSWPAPDYEAMLEAGADPWAVAFMHAARDEVPNKPSSTWKLSRWVEQVKLLRGFAVGLTDGTYSVERTKEELGKLSQFKNMVSRIELYQLVGHAQSLRGVSVSYGSYSVYNGVEYNPAKIIWTVEQKAKATAFSNWPRILAEGDTKEQALANFKAKYESLEINKPASKEVKFGIFSTMGESGYRIGKKIGRNSILLTDSFATIKEAREYLRAHQDELVKKLEKAKEIPPVRRDTNEPRVGEDMRGGQDVTPQMFGETFGFKGVEFGNWVEQKKRQQDLNDAFDALMDMAAILEIPPKALSLNGELGLAFGARGTGGIDAAKAHYEPTYVVINLTKKDGAGSLGHEWFHALDNYFSRMRGEKDKFTTKALDVSLAARNSAFIANTAIRKEMIEAFGGVVRAINQTRMKARSAKLDAKRNKDYWMTGEEMAARAYESYLISKLQDQNASNDYLANIVSEETWKAAEAMGFELDDSYPYPTAGEVPAIRAAFDSFFATIQTKETDTGTALFSRKVERDRSNIDTALRRMGKFVDEFERGSLKDSDTQSLGNTPVVLQALGADNLQLNIDGATIRKVLGGKHRYYITPTMLRELPEHLYDPLAVFDSPSADGAPGKLLLTELTDGVTGRPVVVAVHLSKRAGRLIVNDIASIYEADAITQRKKFTPESLEYYRDEKSLEAATTDKLDISLSAVVQSAQGLDRRIITETDIVNQYGALFSRTTPFYSPLARAIDGAKFETAPAGQWKLWLAGNAAKLGIKKDEIQWSGINEWLDLQGKGKITKADVLNYLNENGVKVEEVTLGADRLTESETERMMELMHANKRNSSEQKELDGLLERNKGLEPKFASYQLPGGANYRKLLLTLPERGHQMEREIRALGITKRLEDVSGTDVRNAGGTEEQVDRWMASFDAARLGNNFRSSHFTQPNILAHVRFNERTDADGKRVLFIEEIQSDWAQKGKKVGFDKKAAVVELKGGKFGVVRPNGVATGPYETRNAAQEVADSYSGAVGVPSAPFVTDTKAWVGLSLKRMIAYAADNGFDRIAWTTGEQQNARYDLSHQVQELKLFNHGDGNWDISARTKGDNRLVDIATRIGADKLEDYVGKDIAKRVVDERKDKGWVSYSGLDLQVGGEGMKAFYDQIVPQVANDILKKLGGGKVGTVTVQTGGMDSDTNPVSPFTGLIDREQPGFDITSSMREHAAQGLPLFSQADGSNINATPPVNEANRGKTNALERAISRGGDLITVTPVHSPSEMLDHPAANAGQRGSDSGRARAAHFRAAEHVAGIFGKQVIPILAEGDFRINGVMHTGNKTDIFVDVRTDKPALVVMGHELSHHMENDTPADYKELVNAISGLLRGHSEYRTKYNIPAEASDDYVSKEMIGDLLGDSFTHPEFWDMVGEHNPSLLRRLAKTVTKWLNGLVMKAVGKGYASEQWVTDTKTAREILAKAVAKYAANRQSKMEPGALDSILDRVYTSRHSQTETEAFQNWFGQSRVKNMQGEPAVVYHGTPNDFSVFDKTRLGKEGHHPTSGLGFFFSQSVTVPNEFAGDGNIMPVYLKIENPYHMGVAEAGGITADDQARAKREDLQKAGYDGIRISNGGIWIAFEPNQIKSAVGNNGNFDGGNNDIRFSRVPNEPIWAVPEISKMDTFLYEVQDKLIDTKRIVEAIKEQAGEIESDWNPYLKEMLYHGRAAKRTQDFLTDELEPLVQAMDQAGVTQNQLNEYLHARHAQERNRVMQERNPDREDNADLSGMSDQEAKRILADAKPELQALGKMADAIITRTRKELADYGLEKQETVDAWGKQYKHYVPLKREGFDDTPGTGQGFSVRGSSTKEATGSHRAVDNILANIAMQRERAITRGEKNRVALSLYGLAKQHPNKSFWKLDKPAQITQINPETGLEEVVAGDLADYQVPKVRYIGKDGTVQERVDPNYKGRNNVLTVRIDGVDHAIIFNDQNPRALRMAEALKNLDMDRLGELIGAMGQVTRYIASVNTQYNPVFGVTNLIRDFQTALLNLQSTPLKGQQQAVMKASVAALKGIYQDARAVRKGKHPTSAYAELWEEFQSVGGQTGYRDMFRTAKDRADAIEHMLDPEWWQKTKAGKVLTLNGVLAKPEQLLFDKAGRHVFQWLSDYNQAMENAMRLAAYKVAKQNGLGKEEAAALAKNLTVNFNKKGRVATQAGALYAFFNASVQGTARIAATLTDGAKPGEYLGKTGKAIVMGGITLGAMQAILLMAAGFDDDEPPEFVRERNLIIPAPGTEKGYITIPMPLGFHVLPNIGRALVEGAVYGKPLDRMTDLMLTMFEAFNPVGTGASLAQTISPTVADPIVALSENKDWTGKRIYREDFSQLNPTPGFTRSKDSASVLAKGLAWGVNAVTGGTDYTPGRFSPTPDQIDYLIGQATGGVGREVTKAMTTAGALVSDEELPTYKIPLVGRLVGSAGGTAGVRDKFYDNIRTLNMHEAEIKGRREHGESVSDYLTDHPEARLAFMAGGIENQIRTLQKRRNQIKESGGNTKMIDAQIANRMKQLNERMAALRAS